MTRIDTQALQERIEQHLSDSCVSLNPFVQGTFHMTFHATMAKAGLVLVRVFHHCLDEKCRPMKSRMVSEVATLRYLKRHTSIPVPDALIHDPDSDNRVGGPWMIMEAVNGNTADSVWDDLNREQKHMLTLAMADMYLSILSLRFDVIGSFYEDRGHFFIGPIATMETNDNPDTAPDPNKSGPFLTTTDWMTAVARQDTAFAMPPSSNFYTPTHQSHIQSIIHDIRSSTDLANDNTPIVLDHVDFSMQNMLVRPDDPTVISGVIDWEGARTVPMWATNPRFMWPIFSPEEDRQHFHGVLRDHLTKKAPEWRRAVSGEETLPMRLLLERAVLSRSEPAAFNWTVPPRHSLSADDASQTGIVYA